MKPRFKIPYKPRRRRMNRKKRSTTGIRAIEKVTRFVFKPTAQYLISNTAGSIVQINPVGSSVTPVNWGSLTAITSSSTIPGYYDFGCGLKFNANNLTTFPGAVQLRYDNYRIRKVILTLDLLTGGAVSHADTGALMAPGIFPTVYAFADQDDAAAPTNSTQVASRAGVKVFKFGQKGKMSCTITVQPKANLSVGAGGTSVGQASNNLWLDSGDPTLPDYFGLKLWFQDVNMDGLTNYGFRAHWTYILEAKGTQNLF